MPEARARSSSRENARRRRALAAAGPENLFLRLPGGPAEATAPAGLNVAEFRRKLRVWFRRHARPLPWRGIHNPYATWLSEIMLQQTRVATVIDRYQLFLERFPTLQALAEAKESDVLALWSGLGYYRRARMLHRAAQFVVREHGGRLPRTAQLLRTLPGVGEYTAAAVASIAFGESIAVVDGNVERVLLRVLGLAEDGTAATGKLVADAAETLVPPPSLPSSRTNPPGNHNQAMMELGATICLPRQPLCLQCPVVEFCRTRGEHPTLARRPQKSRTVAYLLALRKSGTVTEVLLERRPAEASLMPGMLELPPLPLPAVEQREPVLRLRHSITNTNFYVQVYSEGAADGVLSLADGWDDSESTDTDAEVLDSVSAATEGNEDESVFVGAPAVPNGAYPLLNSVPASPADLRWMPVAKLHELPLTGLARKVLQRLDVMSVSALRLPSV